MYPEYEIFGLKLPTWGTMVAIGVLALVAVMFYYFKKEKLNDNKIDRLLILTALSGLIMYLFAMFFDALWHNLKEYHETGVFKWEWWGVTFSGGLVGALLTYFIGYWFLFKKERYNVFHYLNYIITGVVITHAFGRIGCFLGGCCYGKETTSWLGINYPVDQMWDGTKWVDVYAKVYPTQLFEAGFLLILFIVLFFFIKKHQLKIYLISYGVFRFLIEFMRGDDRGNTIFGIISPSQFLSIVMIVCGILLFIFQEKIENALKRKYNPDLVADGVPTSNSSVVLDSNLTEDEEQENQAK